MFFLNRKHSITWKHRQQSVNKQQATLDFSFLGDNLNWNLLGELDFGSFSFLLLASDFAASGCSFDSSFFELNRPAMAWIRLRRRSLSLGFFDEEDGGVDEEFNEEGGRAASSSLICESAGDRPAHK